MIYEIQEKCETCAAMGRRSLLLQKVGCPVGVAEYLPVDNHIFDSVKEGDHIEIIIKEVDYAEDDDPQRP